ncbi:hypothetical protein ONZ45_g13762 [Pleurotus djamor]|nr:hypothetical protein ONZ45_g13762 [Pleurotus djamor]
MFRRLAELPIPLRGSIFKDSDVVQVSYSIRDHTQNVKRTVDASLVLASPENTIKASSQDVPSDVIASVFSPSDQVKIVLRESKDKEKTRRFVDVWKDGRMDSSIEVTDTHGSFYSDDFLGSMSFSDDEDAFLYTAEANPPAKDASDIDRFKFTPNFGEEISLYLDHLRRMSTLGKLLSVARTKSSLLGTILREMEDYWVSNTALTDRCPSGNFTSHNKALRSLVQSLPSRVLKSPHRKFPPGPLVYHPPAIKFFGFQVTNETRVVVDVVWEPSQPGGFPGLYLEILPQRPFIHLGGKLYIACHSIWGSRTKVLLIDVADSGITDLTTDERDGGELYSWSVLGTDGVDRILCSRSSPTKPHVIVLLKLDHDKPCATPSLRILDSPTFDDDLLGVLNDVTVTVHPIHGRFPAETIVYKPKTTDPSHVPPLITIPHGGPHSTTTTAFNAGTVALALEGSG